jgi:hypothetical protein
MTYRELRNALNSVSEEQLDDDVTIEQPEYGDMYPATLLTNLDKKSLHKGHLFLKAI